LRIRYPAVPSTKKAAGCGPFANTITARMAPHRSHRSKVTRACSAPLHHTAKAANENIVTRVSGSAMVSFCSSIGQSMNASAAKIEAPIEATRITID
jgi:hypothetical protein